MTDFRGKVKRFIFRKTRDYQSKNGYYLGHSSTPTEVKNFITLLKPYNTDKGLIRLGDKGDGGYLLPDDLENIEACFSPGVGAKSTFEEDCISRGMKAFLADASVDKLPSTNQNLHFTKKFIGASNDETYTTLDNWVKTSDVSDDSDLLLQMDIEGYEYMSLINLSEQLLNRFRIIVMEVHFLEKLWEPHFFQIANTAFSKILKNHTCTHIHPNNCSDIVELKGIKIAPAIEVTFLRNDRITKKSPATTFPHQLDVNNLNRRSVDLPTNWYK